MADQAPSPLENKESKPDPRVVKRQNDAIIAESEAKIAKAQKEIAEANLDIANAGDKSLQETVHRKALAEAAKTSSEANKAASEAEKASAEAQKAALTAELPAHSAAPLDGKVELDDKVGYYSELLAYRSLAQAAREIASRLQKRVDPARELYLVSRADWQQAAAQLAEITSRLHTFQLFFDELDHYYVEADGLTLSRHEAAPLAVLSAAPAILGALVDVAALFRKDRSIKGKTIALNQTALQAEVANELISRQAKVFLPSLHFATSSPILITFAKVREAEVNVRLKRFQIERAISSLTQQIEPLERQLKSAQEKLAAIPAEQTEPRRAQEQVVQNLQEQLDRPKQQKANAEAAKSQFDAVLTAFTEFSLKLITVPEGGTISPLTALSEVSLLAEKPQLLYLSIVSQGGEYEARKSLWSSGKMYHRGGVVCVYILFTPTGQMLASGTVENDLQTEEGRLITPPTPNPYG